jgi:hypothetical protein
MTTLMTLDEYLTADPNLRPPRPCPEFIPHPLPSLASREMSLHSAVSVHGYLPINGRKVWYESMLERCRGVLARLRLDVVSIAEQPPAVEYVDDDGRRRPHVFDFKFDTTTLGRVLIAVKPSDRVVKTGVDRIVELTREQLSPSVADGVGLFTEEALSIVDLFNADAVNMATRDPCPEDDAVLDKVLRKLKGNAWASNTASGPRKNWRRCAIHRHGGPLRRRSESAPERSGRYLRRRQPRRHQSPAPPCRLAASHGHAAQAGPRSRQGEADAREADQGEARTSPTAAEAPARVETQGAKMSIYDENPDPTAYLRELLDPAERDRVDKIERVKTAYITSDRDDDLARLLKRLTTNAVIRRDPTKPHGAGNRVEGKGICIVAPSGAGKSRLLEETFRDHPAFPNFRDPNDKWCPLVGITAPSPATLGQLGIRLLDVMGYAADRDLKENQAWSRVRSQVKTNQVLFVWIDDLNNVLTMSSEEEIQKVRDTLKDLLNNPGWPLQVIVSGVPDLLPFFRADKQLRRRFRYLFLGKLAPADHAVFLQSSIEHYCELSEIKLAVKPEEDLVGRLLHAGALEMGVCLEIAVDAVVEALERNSSKLERMDFANTFADRHTLSDDQNPFVAPGWQMIDTTRLYSKDEERIDDAVTPLAAKRAKRRRRRK